MIEHHIAKSGIGYPEDLTLLQQLRAGSVQAADLADMTMGLRRGD